MADPFRQCIFSVFGGHVDVTGDILHGKTSPLRHDSRGVYIGLPQDLPVTRYHSLAGTHATLPDCLEVSSWIATGPDGGKGIIMGVRHKTLLVEGVQFHPESILTADGRTMLRNFLKMQGGTWAENEDHQKATEQKPLTKGQEMPKANGTSHEKTRNEDKVSILDRIYKHRRHAVTAQKLLPSQRPQDFQAVYDLDLSPAQISFPERLRLSPFPLSLMAEIKRASPSKGAIAMNMCAPAQARRYALAGASVISVLTEPEWFKGSIEDLRSVRQALEGLTNRPAILRKEFIFDEYQILEARLTGADTVLLIVKMLDQSSLKRLYQYSQSLGMEPLVEVNTSDEMEIAIELGAQVIGVNNRNLTSFEVDLDTTSRLMGKVPTGTIVCALSGISGPDDVKAYQENGVSGVLVGEALMRAENITSFVSSLLGGSNISTADSLQATTMVKICGTRTPDAAKAAIDAGADMIGIILVEGRKRCVSLDAGIAISRVVRATKKPQRDTRSLVKYHDECISGDFFEHTARLIRESDRALLVGVFQHQPLSYILAQQRLLHLDMVQLHGSEPLEWASLIPVPVIRRFGVMDAGLSKRGYHCLPLLDSAKGGSGEITKLASAGNTLKYDAGLRLLLAGGLHAENVKDVLQEAKTSGLNVVAVDVSSGVEKEGIQDIEKIRQFIHHAKS